MGDEHRVAMDAVVVQASNRRGGGGPDDGECTAVDAVTDLFTSEQWDLELDVSPPDGAPFRHSARYKLPKGLGARRKLRNLRLAPGLAVPVLVSADRATVDIDWDLFLAQGGVARATAIAQERGAQQGASELGKMLAKSPKKAAKQREFILTHGAEMASQVPTGVRPAGEFSRHISSLVQGGALSQEEGDEFLRQAGLL